MLGTGINTLAVLAGGFAGLFLKSGLKESYRQVIHHASALSVLFVGLSGAISNMLDPSANAVLFIISLVIGGIIGTWLNLEEKMASLGDVLEDKLSQSTLRGQFSEGFVSASLLFCVGSMAILGPLESGINGNHDILLAKSVIDGIVALVMASTLGVGVVFSAVSVLVYQGVITLLAGSLAPFLSADMLRELSIVGGILIFCLGTNMLKLTRIKVSNLLPAVFVPIVYYLLASVLV